MNPQSHELSNSTICQGGNVSIKDENTLFRVVAEEVENGPLYELPLCDFRTGEQTKSFEQTYSVGGCEIMLCVHCTIWMHAHYENGTAGPNELREILDKEAYLYAFYLEGEEVTLTDEQRIELEEAIENKMDIE